MKYILLATTFALICTGCSTGSLVLDTYDNHKLGNSYYFDGDMITLFSDKYELISKKKYIYTSSDDFIAYQIALVKYGFDYPTKQNEVQKQVVNEIIESLNNWFLYDDNGINSKRRHRFDKDEFFAIENAYRNAFKTRLDKCVRQSVTNNNIHSVLLMLVDKSIVEFNNKYQEEFSYK